jgi:hypothetical protein
MRSVGTRRGATQRRSGCRVRTRRRLQPQIFAGVGSGRCLFGLPFRRRGGGFAQRRRSNRLQLILIGIIRRVRRWIGNLHRRFWRDPRRRPAQRRRSRRLELKIVSLHGLLRPISVLRAQPQGRRRKESGLDGRGGRSKRSGIVWRVQMRLFLRNAHDLLTPRATRGLSCQHVRSLDFVSARMALKSNHGVAPVAGGAARSAGQVAVRTDGGFVRLGWAPCWKRNADARRILKIVSRPRRDCKLFGPVLELGQLRFPL